jgi:hypothetical protein
LHGRYQKQLKIMYVDCEASEAWQMYVRKYFELADEVNDMWKLRRVEIVPVEL